MDTRLQQRLVRYDNMKNLRSQGDGYCNQQRHRHEQHESRQGQDQRKNAMTSTERGRMRAPPPPPPPPPKPRRNHKRHPSPAVPTNGKAQPRRGSEPATRNAASCPSSPLIGRKSWCPVPHSGSRLQHRQDAGPATASAAGHHQHHQRQHLGDTTRPCPSSPMPNSAKAGHQQQPEEGSPEAHRRSLGIITATDQTSSCESLLSAASHRSSHSAGEPHCRLLRSVDVSALLQDNGCKHGSAGSASNHPMATVTATTAATAATTTTTTTRSADPEESLRRASLQMRSEADDREVDFFGPRRTASPRASRGSLSSVASTMSANAASSALPPPASSSPSPALGNKGVKKKLRKKKERERQRQRRITPPALARPSTLHDDRPQAENDGDTSACNSDADATPRASPDTQRRRRNRHRRNQQHSPFSDPTNENTPPGSPRSPRASRCQSMCSPHVRVAVTDEERGESDSDGGRRYSRSPKNVRRKIAESDDRESIVRGVLSKVNSIASVMTPRRRRKMLGKVRKVVETSNVTLAGVQQCLPAAVSEELVRRMSQIQTAEQQDEQRATGSNSSLAVPTSLWSTRKADKGSNYSLDVPLPTDALKRNGSRTSLTPLTPGVVRDARCSDTGTDTSSVTSSCCSSHRNSRAWCACGSTRSTTSASSADSRWSTRESEDPGYAAIDSDSLAYDSAEDSIVHEEDAAARYNLLHTSAGDAERHSRALTRGDEKITACSDEDSAYARISQVLCDELWDNGWLAGTRLNDSDLDIYDEDYDPTAVYTRVIPKELRSKSPPLPIREYILKHYKFKGEGPEPSTNDESRSQARRAAYLYRLKVGQKRRNSPKRCLGRNSGTAASYE